MSELPILLLDDGLPVPAPAREGDAGLDLRSSIDATIAPAGGRLLVPTGIALELPSGTAGLVLPRSGLALSHGVTCLNSPGLIDSGYHGEVKVILANLDPTEPFRVKRGDRIAQLVVVDIRVLTPVAVGELSSSERGDGGFGHSGRT